MPPPAASTTSAVRDVVIPSRVLCPMAPARNEPLPTLVCQRATLPAALAIARVRQRLCTWMPPPSLLRESSRRLESIVPSPLLPAHLSVQPRGPSVRACATVAPQCGPMHRRLHQRMHVQAHRRTRSSSRVSHRSRPSRQPPPLRQPRTSSANRNVAALRPATRPGSRTAPRPRRPALSPRRTWRPSSRRAS